MTLWPSLKHVTRFEYGDSLSRDIRSDGDVPVFGSNGVVGSHDVANTLGPAIIVGRKGSYGKVTWTDVPGFCIDTAYYLDSRHTGTNLRWLYWALQTLGLDQNSEDTGVPGLSRESAYVTKVRCPSPQEQQRIANFLDEQTAQIDVLIAGKENLSEKLEELRLARIYAALSQSAVAGGALKSTRDEWFSGVPAHWSFCPLNYRYEVQLGKMLDEKRISGEYLLPYLRNTDVQWDRVNVEGLPMMDFAPHELERYTLRVGDLLVCEGGEVGRAAIWTSPTEVIGYQKALHRVRPRDARIDVPRFLFYALYDSAKRGRFDSREKATIAHLTAEAFRRYRFPFPPYVEQVSIVRHLDEMMSKIDALQQHTEEHCSKLREYRSSLISAAVTGQIDINDFGQKSA